MFIFYGWGSDSKKLKLYKNRSCLGCNRDSVPKQVVYQYSYVSLFFIRLIKWDKRYFLQCPYCGNVTAISKYEFQSIKKGIPAPQPQSQPQPQKSAEPFGDVLASPDAAQETGTQTGAAQSEAVPPPVPEAEPAAEIPSPEETGAAAE